MIHADYVNFDALLGASKNIHKQLLHLLFGDILQHIGYLFNSVENVTMVLDFLEDPVAFFKEVVVRSGVIRTN